MQEQIRKRHQDRFMGWVTDRFMGFPSGLAGEESACNAGDEGLIAGLGRSPRGGHGKPLQYSCQGNPMDRGAWQAMVQEVAKSWI